MTASCVARGGEYLGNGLAPNGAVLLAAFSELPMAPIATDFDPLSGKLFVSFLGVTGRRKSDLEQAARFAQIVAKSAEVGVSPAAVASGLSRDIGESPGAHFPFFFASIDLNRLTGAYSCGGQCPIVVGEGAVTVLEQTGPPLGFSPSVEYDEEFFSLASGHTLMVYNFDLAIGFSVDPWLSRPWRVSPTMHFSSVTGLRRRGLTTAWTRQAGKLRCSYCRCPLPRIGGPSSGLAPGEAQLSTRSWNLILAGQRAAIGWRRT
jgi:hypothetical protein